MHLQAASPSQNRFFVDERASRQGITLTDHLLELANGQQAKVLPREVDARAIRPARRTTTPPADN